MKKFYIVSYDLKVPGRDYTSLYDSIKSYNDWQHPLESTWLLYTNDNADQISSKLRGNGNMDNSDLLFICELNIDNRQGWLDKEVWNWIKARMNK